MRLITAVQLYQPENFQKVLQGLFDAMFGQPKNLNDMSELVALAQSLELDIDQVQAWLVDDHVKNQLKQVTEEAIERGVFGAPTWFVGDEMYWGLIIYILLNMHCKQWNSI